jgi:hypothetical protein
MSKKISLILIDAPLDIMQTCLCSCASLRACAWLLIQSTTFANFVYPQPIFLQHYVFVLAYHILWLSIFHGVNVVIPLMI